MSVDAGGGKLKFQVTKGHQKSKQTSIIFFLFFLNFRKCRVADGPRPCCGKVIFYNEGRTMHVAWAHAIR